MSLVRVGAEYYSTDELFDEGALKVNDAAAFAGVSRDTVYRLMNSGDWPYSAGRGGRKVPKRAIVLWLQQGLRGRRGA